MLSIIAKMVEEWWQENAELKYINSLTWEQNKHSVALIAIEQVPHNQWQVKTAFAALKVYHSLIL